MQEVGLLRWKIRIRRKAAVIRAIGDPVWVLCVFGSRGHLHHYIIVYKCSVKYVHVPLFYTSGRRSIKYRQSFRFRVMLPLYVPHITV
jgi:hypothetical protein